MKEILFVILFFATGVNASCIQIGFGSEYCSDDISISETGGASGFAYTDEVCRQSLRVQRDDIIKRFDPSFDHERLADNPFWKNLLNSKLRKSYQCEDYYNRNKAEIDETYRVEFDLQYPEYKQECSFKTLSENFLVSLENATLKKVWVGEHGSSNDFVQNTIDIMKSDEVGCAEYVIENEDALANDYREYYSKRAMDDL